MTQVHSIAMPRVYVRFAARPRPESNIFLVSGTWSSIQNIHRRIGLEANDLVTHFRQIFTNRLDASPAFTQYQPDIDSKTQWHFCPGEQLSQPTHS